MPWAELTLVLLSALIAGAVNALAGGGTLLLFPALVALGLSPVVANATAASALLMGYATSAYAFRAELRQLLGVVEQRRQVHKLIALTLLGSSLGAYALTQISAASFAFFIPLLLLFATLLFAYGNALHQQLQKHLRNGFTYYAYALLLLVSIYGGFFWCWYGDFTDVCFSSNVVLVNASTTRHKAATFLGHWCRCSDAVCRVWLN